jgi:aspartate aminotransferase
MSLPMKITISDRLGRVKPSQTQQVTLAAQGLQQQGVSVIDLGAGEPDFDTPAHIGRAGIEAIQEGFTKYTANAGIPELKDAVAEKYRLTYGVRYGADEVMICAGGKQALFNVAMALFDSGDEVITHSPVWPTITEQIKLAGAAPVLVRTYAEERFQVRAERVLDAVTPRTRAIVLNSPSNPTGALISERELEIIVQETENAGIWLVIDLCYEHLLHDDAVSHNLPMVVEKARDRVVLIGSASKTYAMTGWRCGWLLGSRDIVAACSTIQSHTTSNVSSITQRAVLAALRDTGSSVEKMRTAYRERRNRFVELLGEEPRIHVVLPDGAFYVFPDISEFLGSDTVRTSVDFAEKLLEDFHVAVTPGEAFDAPGYIRISYAASIDDLTEGAKRICQFARSCESVV